MGARLRRALAAIPSDYSSARLALLILALFYVGARRLEHLRYLAGDPLIGRFCGLARLPTVRTMSNWLKQFTQATLAPLVQLNHDLVVEALGACRLPRLTLDVDGTVISTGAQVRWVFRGFDQLGSDESVPVVRGHAAQDSIVRCASERRGGRS